MANEVFVKPVGSDLHVNLGGFYTKKASEEYTKVFYEEYAKGVASIPNKKNVVVDCTKLKVFPAEVVSGVEEGLKVYKKDFKNCIMKVSKDNSILQVQLKRMCSNVGLPMTLEQV